MSLFRVKEWWSTKLTGTSGDEEEFGNESMTTAALIAQEAGVEEIIVGSYSGIIRVFAPTVSLEADSGVASRIVNPFRPEHLLIEQQLADPILQVSTGYFSTGSQRRNVAVLHPRKLIVYSFGGTEGKVEHGNQYGLRHVYEHNLQRGAYNMVTGPFGGIKGRDFMCVQSLDGALSMFEQENFAFSRFLPGFLIPGPLAYCAQSDSFITVTSKWRLESYKYQMLAVAAEVQTKEQAATTTTGKRVTPDWTFNLGEAGLQIQTFEPQTTPPSVFVLGDRSLFCFTPSGMLTFMLKLMDEPMLMHVYDAIPEGPIHFAVATCSKTLLFYASTTLVWNAQLNHTPVALQVADYKSMRGIVTSLSDTGHLQCAYLGSDPAFYGLPAADNRQVIDFVAKREEFRELQATIKNAGEKKLDDQLTEATKKPDLVFGCADDNELDSVSFAYDSELGDQEQVPSVTKKMFIVPSTLIENVHVAVCVNRPLVTQHPQFHFKRLDQQASFNACIYLKHAFVPSDLTITVQVAYNLPSSPTKLKLFYLSLPLLLIARPVPPQKQSQYKYTLESATDLADLNSLFPEFCTESSAEDGGTSAAMGFQLRGQSATTVTLLAAKSSKKYRVQSDSFECICVILSEFINRLQAKDSSQTPLPDLIGFSGTMPLQEYFSFIDRHFEVRKRYEKLDEVLAQRCAQFRVVQRRLLTKFKDATPAPLAHMDALLEMTYRQIQGLSSAMSEHRDTLESSSCNVAASTRFVLILLQLQLQQRSHDPAAILLSEILSPIVGVLSDMGWEERLEYSLTCVHHMLNKNQPPAAIKDSELNPMTGTVKLKKGIGSLVDKLLKGQSLAPVDPTRMLDPQVASQLNAKAVAKRRKSRDNAAATKHNQLSTIDEDSNSVDLSNADLAMPKEPLAAAFTQITSTIPEPIAEEKESEVEAELNEASDVSSEASVKLGPTPAADYLFDNASKPTSPEVVTGTSRRSSEASEATRQSTPSDPGHRRFSQDGGQDRLPQLQQNPQLVIGNGDIAKPMSPGNQSMRSISTRSPLSTGSVGSRPMSSSGQPGPPSDRNTRPGSGRSVLSPIGNRVPISSEGILSSGRSLKSSNSAIADSAEEQEAIAQLERPKTGDKQDDSTKSVDDEDFF